MIYLRLNSVLFHRARQIGWQIAYHYREFGLDMVAMKKEVTE